MPDQSAFNTFINQMMSSFSPPMPPGMGMPGMGMPGMGQMPFGSQSQMGGDMPWTDYMLNWQKNVLEAYLAMLEAMNIDSEDQLNQMLKSSLAMWMEMMGSQGRVAQNSVSQHRDMVKAMLEEVKRQLAPEERQKAEHGEEQAPDHGEV